MIHVLFFARLREQLGCDKISVEATQLDSEGISVETLLQQLCESHPEWAQWLLARDVLVALNQTICDKSATVQSGDEVAFFPPVTGG